MRRYIGLVRYSRPARRRDAASATSGERDIDFQRETKDERERERERAATARPVCASCRGTNPTDPCAIPDRGRGRGEGWIHGQGRVESKPPRAVPVRPSLALSAGTRALSFTVLLAAPIPPLVSYTATNVIPRRGGGREPFVNALIGAH
jgi:hypothetical protein